jgi:hypothetical protein
MTARVRHPRNPATDDLPTENEMLRQIRVTGEAAWQNRISRPQVEGWLSNFTGEVFSAEYERRMALWMLCNFVFYNQNEVRHLCETAFRELLHYTLSTLPPQDKRDWNDAAGRMLDNTRFYHSGRPGESGGFVLYFFRQVNRLGVRHFLTQPDKLPPSVDTVVFVDDVVLSGRQATPYLNRATAAYDENKRKILLVFFSTDEAEDLLKQNDITVISCIKLHGRSKCFSDDSIVFVNHPLHRNSCKAIAEAYGEKIMPAHPLGYDDGQYAFGFYYNTPDNTLPIFWAEHEGWIPIMKRYEKKYGKGLDELGRFI